MHSPARNQAYTLLEVLVDLAAGSLLLLGILQSYLALQRSFLFAINWSETRVAQARVIDSMAQDLRNATAVSATGAALTLTLPARFSAYETSGALAGDPQIGSTMNTPAISATTGNFLLPNGVVTVIYEISGNRVNRRLQQPGLSPDPTRTVGVFSGTVTLSFTNTSGLPFTAEDTIVPTVSASLQSWNSNQPTVPSVMTDTVLLRGTLNP